MASIQQLDACVSNWWQLVQAIEKCEIFCDKGSLNLRTSQGSREESWGKWSFIHYVLHVNTMLQQETGESHQQLVPQSKLHHQPGAMSAAWAKTNRNLSVFLWFCLWYVNFYTLLMFEEIECSLVHSQALDVNTAVQNLKHHSPFCWEWQHWCT